MMKLPEPTLTRSFSRWMHRWLRSSLLVTAGASLAALPVSGEVLLEYNLTSLPGGQEETVPTTVADGMAAGNLVRGAGIEATALKNGMSSNTWTHIAGGEDGRQIAMDNDEYFEFTISVAPGYIGSLETLDHNLRRSSNYSPRFYEWQYSLDGFATPGNTAVPEGPIWTDLGWTESSFAYRGRNNGSGGVADNYNYMLQDLDDQNGNPMPTFILSGIQDLQNLPGGTKVTFRLYGWGDDETRDSGSVAFGRHDGPKVGGTVILDPTLGDEVPLQVVSEFSETDPVPGIHMYAEGTTVTATASPVTEGSATRYAPIGWTGGGSVSSGDGGSTTFTLNEPSTIEWQWQRENRLLITAAGEGSVNVTTSERRPLLNWSFNGWNYSSDGSLQPGEQSNENGVPTSFEASEVMPSIVTRAPYDEGSETGVNPRALGGGSFSSEKWANTPTLAVAIETQKYYQFVVTPKPGEVVSFHSLFMRYRYTQSAAHSIALLYSLDNFQTYKIIESVRIQDQSSGTQDQVTRTFLFPSDLELENVSSEITFRIYGWGGTGSGGGTFALRSGGSNVDDLILYGGNSATMTVSASESLWLDSSALFNIKAVADSNSLFTGWSGDFFSNVAELRGVALQEPKTVTANFAADSNASGIPDDWKLLHFETLDVDPGLDPDVDGFTNYEEYLRGTDPNFAEELLVVGAVPLSIWENPQRDPKNPGHFITGYYSPEFRGAWDRSNHYRNADDPFHPEGLPVPVVDSVSFDGPRMIIREDSWEEEWDDATVETVFSAGDNDGSTFFFRYQDELNWYRVTVAGQVTNAPTRPAAQVSIQSRINGVYSGIVAKEGPASDPTDVTGYKRLRVRFTPRMEGGQPKIDIAVSAWSEPAQGWETASFGHREWTISDELGWGRAGFGTFAQGGFTQDELTWNPVTAGTMFESFIISRNEEVLLDVDWDLSPRPGDFPEGWENPFASDDDLDGDWRVSAHGTITERSASGGATSGSLKNPAADAEAPMFLLDSIGTSSYVLDIGIHPFEVGANGFIYDYIDSDNYSRVLFANTSHGLSNSIPSGLTVSRKQDGVWSDIVIGDTGFIYRPAQPFNVSFARSGQNYVMSAEEVDVPGQVYRWEWSDSTAPALGGRYGFTSWQSGNAHFLSLESYGAVVESVDGIAIIGIEKVGEMIVLTVDNPSGDPYKVERTVDLASGEWETVDTEQTETSWSGPIPSGADKAFWRLNR